MPRPSIYDQKKTAVLRASVTPMAKEQFEKYALEKGVSVSQLLEEMARDDAIMKSAMLLGESLAASSNQP